MSEKKTLEYINNLLKKVEEVRLAIENKGCLEIDYEIDKVIFQIFKFATCEFKGKKMMKFQEQILSIDASVSNIRKLLEEHNTDYALKKIEFELIPLIENMRMEFYYYTWIYPDKKMMTDYYENELKTYCDNKYMQKAIKEGKYRYDLSIVVVAYNKLEYTQLCVESILNYWPENLCCELVLMNHGSTDGTKEYFESIQTAKQVDIAVNGGGVGIWDRIVEGKYVVVVCNDVVVTPNAIENMYRCIVSDDNIAWVVATTPNISNNQSIPGEYGDMEEMFLFAKKNNVSNSKRWEEKVRICDPIAMYSIEKRFECICGRVQVQPNGCFIDDKMSMLYRRSGYKLMLAKDAFCYHFGSITLKDELKDNMSKFYTKGRIDFLKEYGMDPWGYGHVYDEKLFENIKLIKNEQVNILGVDVGLGANVLKLVSILKEQNDRMDVWLSNLIHSSMNSVDLKSFSNEVEQISGWSIFQNKPNRLYNYILLENNVEEGYDSIRDLLCWKEKDGVLLIRTENNRIKEKIVKEYEGKEISYNGCNCWIEVI